jgi:hypothetical protein
MTSHYGVYKDDTHPLAVRIWGHRLRTGQHWMEYMLEFLSVLSGFKYRFGQGLLEHADQDDYLTTYRVPTRLGLRRFVFYDEREKTRDSRDTRAVAELRHGLRTYMPIASGREDVIEQVRSLLRSFSAIEEERSWYAKSLFPVHEQFLLWEGLRKGSTLKEYLQPADQLNLHDLDRGIEFSTRNFFARGGELYYLIVSAGTEHDLAKRGRIAAKLEALLTQHNQSLGKIAEVIDATWNQLSSNGESTIDGTVGWILDPDCALYRQIADDLDTFLNNDLDSLECLELLAHLIGFHVIMYIYHRAHPASDPEGHASGSCLDACRPMLLVDLLGEQDSGIVREQSAALLREQDDLQLRQARDLIEQKVREWAREESNTAELGEYLKIETERFFQIGQKKAKDKYNSLIDRVTARYDLAGANREMVIRSYSNAIFEALSSEFRKNFLGVHRKIGRAIGLIAPRKGVAIRFVLGDTLLKTLVLAMLPRGEGGVVPFGDFLERLYQHYGIIVGPGEAHSSGLGARLRINEEYYTRNRDALLGRMQRAGLLTQYSDATALVRRR